MQQLKISRVFDAGNDVTLATSDCLEFLGTIPDASAQLVITSPPYNIGKSYERKRSTIEEYVSQQARVIGEAVRILKPGGSICWQVGHYINGHSQIIPLDMLLYPCFAVHQAKSAIFLRNRIIWHFEFGYNSKQRFSGRHEVILWFTKGDNYTFNLDALRVPQKYPGKRAYQGPQKGKLSGNPLGKNPGDVWIFPNVKGKHVEKTCHPCQFPIELADRLIEAFTNKKDLIVDPYVGTGSSVAAAILRQRRAAGCDAIAQYVRIARNRVKLAADGDLRFRPRSRPVYEPQANTALTTVPEEFLRQRAQVQGTKETVETKSSPPSNDDRLPQTAPLITRNVA
ncbi:site-specific DNA-methyltransferase [soil metagenome]